MFRDEVLLILEFGVQLSCTSNVLRGIRTVNYQSLSVSNRPVGRNAMVHGVVAWEDSVNDEGSIGRLVTTSILGNRFFFSVVGTTQGAVPYWMVKRCLGVCFEALQNYLFPCSYRLPQESLRVCP